MRVLGVDLYSGSLNSRSQPRYSMVLLEDGVVRAREEVSRRRLLKTIRELRPDRVACDNVYELFRKDRERSFYYLLPENTRVVQVNGPPGTQRPLHVVAREKGLKLSAKASSVEEAEACALLAFMNVGVFAEMFTGESIITVTRGRSPGKGGQSQNRLRRRVHERVGRVIREVEAILREDGIPFSLSVARADFGYSRGEFHVKAPISAIARVKKGRGPDVQVKKLPVERDKLEFIPVAIEEKAVIAGIDPGTTIGLAILDLDGGLCEVCSSREFSVKDILSSLLKYPQVLVVASDVSPAPRLVEKISTSLSAVLYTPSRTLTVAEKKALVDSRYARNYANSHERDAIAAALKAYNHFKSKLDNLDKRLRKKDLTALSREVKGMAIKGISLDRAVRNLTKAGSAPRETRRKKGEQPRKPGLVKTLREEIRLIKKERDELRRVVRSMKERISTLEKQLLKNDRDMRRRILEDRELKKRNKEIATLRSMLRAERKEKAALRRELQALKRRLLLESSEDLVLVKVIQKFSREGISLDSRMVKKGDVIYLPDPTGGGKAAAEKLLHLEPRAVIVDIEKLSEPAAAILRGAVILDPERVKMKMLDGYGLADKSSLDAEIRRAAEKMRIQQAAAKKKWLEEYIRKYRQERKKK
jgi:hypothetical protein